ncbi:TPA: ead/Ea22-like family protein [Enterobacter cloacae]|nr:ead/Ea22-like family protein [Enterobacter cloacae]
MSNIDKRALREAAEKAISAGDGNWQTWREAGMNSPEIFTSSGHIVATVNGSFSVVRSDFIAAADPATVLALLDELEATYSRIGELEVIATDYGMKFQMAQDALKQQSLLHKSQLEVAEKRIADYQARLDRIERRCDHHGSVYWDVSNVKRCAKCGMAIIESANGATS